MSDGHLGEVDQIQGICEAVEELWTEAGSGGGSGHAATHDILVFLSGEREIRDTADALTAMRLPKTEVVPLFARLSAAEQHRIFAPHQGRRIVLATNIAETSLTVPGIRYVVDAGTARISRYSQRLKVQRLPIEAISQASARQRSGRCGRLADGIAIRLYDEQDFAARPEFTEPEILRTSLAAVILQMTALRLGEVADFPFVDPPDSRQVTDGIRLLHELRAIEELDAKPARGRHPARPATRRLTHFGATMASLPVDPRMARMLIEADRLGVLREVLVIVAGMSIQDPRERPLDNQELAAAAHKRFRDDGSDLITVLRLWGYVRERQGELSSSAFRRLCKAEYLHYLRIREWQDLVTQLRSACRRAGMDTARGGSHGEPDTDAIHKAVLAGLLSHIGQWDESRRDYLGARGARFAVAPGSALFRRRADYVMAGELVETSRLWARLVARIDPRWAEELGEHLVARTYSEPRWSAKQGSAVATEKVTLYGIPLVVARTVPYGRIGPAQSRELFIRHALVEGDWTTRHAFFHDNAALADRLGELEAKARRRDLVVDDEALFRFYDERIPAEVVSGRHFDSWWKKAGRSSPALLTFTEDDLLSVAAHGVSGADFPSVWRHDGLDLPVTYRFEPGAARDGVSVHVSTDVLNQVHGAGFDWQVPGLREDLVTALIRTLPKGTRRLLVPAADHARAVLPQIQRFAAEHGGDEAAPRTSLAVVLAQALHDHAGVAVRPEDLDPAAVPRHLRVTFVVEDSRGEVVAEGPDLDALRDAVAPQVRQRLADAGRSFERAGLTDWDLDTVPEEFEREVRGSGARVRGYPALVDDGATVALRVLPTRAEALAEHRLGVRRLLLLNTAAPWKRVLANLSNSEKLALGHNPHGSVPALLEDCLACAVDAIVSEQVRHTPRTAEEFATALLAVRNHAATRVLGVVRAVEPILAAHLDVVRALDATQGPAAAYLVEDVRAQLRELLRPGFVADAGESRLPHLRRYLGAIRLRLDKAGGNLTRDRDLTGQVQAVEDAYAELQSLLRPTERSRADIVDIAWMIEELRVSFFAQTLGTAYPVSVQRVTRALTSARTAGTESSPPPRR
jgi:ATP-dependent helicase HrpA